MQLFRNASKSLIFAVHIASEVIISVLHFEFSRQKYASKTIFIGFDMKIEMRHFTWISNTVNSCGLKKTDDL